MLRKLTTTFYVDHIKPRSQNHKTFKTLKILRQGSIDLQRRQTGRSSLADDFRNRPYNRNEGILSRGKAKGSSVTSPDSASMALACETMSSKGDWRPKCFMKPSILSSRILQTRVSVRQKKAASVWESMLHCNPSIHRKTCLWCSCTA